MNKRELGILATLGVVMLVARVIFIFEVPDLDTDSYAHVHVGRVLVDDPSNLAIHWVWLPGWHYALMLFLHPFGLGFTGIRILQALLASLGPLLIYRHAREEKLFAAILFTCAALPNLAGTSALMEVCFTLLIALTAISIDAKHAWRAALFLTLACTLRYEAWFAVVGLGVSLALQRSRQALIAFALPAICLASYIVWRRTTDGEWLWFVRETYRFTHMQRGVTGVEHGTLFQIAWFPILLPFMVLGPAMVLGIAEVIDKRHRSSWRASTVVPVSLIAFLLLSYMGKGALGQARYLTVLMPFACIAIANAGSRIAKKYPGWRSSVLAASLVSILGSMLFMMSRNASSALARESHFREMETWALTPPPPPASSPSQ